MSSYQGWTNSATFLAQQYIIQEQGLYDGLCALIRDNPQTNGADFRDWLVSQKIRVVGNANPVVDEALGCGMVSATTIRLDSWAEGNINWDEIVCTQAKEMGLAKRSITKKMVP